jgi:tetratricopeptide (TPR) repeat protein
VLAALAAGGFFLYGRHANALSEKDFILLTDFTNTTGDSVFDGTLKQALAVQLEQSPFLNVYPQERIRQALRYAGRSPDDRVTVPIARDICQREAVKAILTGTISPLGSNYVVSLEALNCRTGDTIARQQAEAPSKEKVLQALGTAAKDIRGPLGETVTSIEHFSAPVEQATTSSLEAMQAFARGDETRARAGDLPGLPFFKHAAELDPNFAMAFARMGAIYGNIGEFQLAQESTQKAYDLRERTSEREKFYIIGHYLQSVTGEVQKQIENYELWAQTYPRDFTPPNNLAVAYTQIGEFQKALSEAQEALRMAPTEVFPYINVIAGYIRLNQLEEAKAIYKQAIEKKLDAMSLHNQRFTIAYLEGDSQEMDRQAAWAAGKTEESTMLVAEAQATQRKNLICNPEGPRPPPPAEFTKTGWAILQRPGPGRIRRWIDTTNGLYGPPPGWRGLETLRGLRKSLKLRARVVLTIPFCRRAGFRRCGRQWKSNAVTRQPQSRR